MKIKYKDINNHNPLIIGETPFGHNGYIVNLQKLIIIGKIAGLKTLKFQIFTLDEDQLPKTRKKIFKNLTLNEQEWKSQ